MVSAGLGWAGLGWVGLGWVSKVHLEHYQCGFFGWAIRIFLVLFSHIKNVQGKEFGAE